MTQTTTYDVIILGAGPAGAAAAALAAAQGLKTALIDRHPELPSSPQIEPLHRDAATLLKKLSIQRSQLALGAIRKVHFYDIPNDQSATASVDPSVDLVDSVQLRDQLRLAATKNGANMTLGSMIETVDAHEEWVQLVSTAGLLFRGRFLIAADGADAWVAQQLGLVEHTLDDPPVIHCRWNAFHSDSPCGSKRKRDSHIEWSLFFTSDRYDDFSYVYRLGDQIILGLISGAGQIDLEGDFRKTVQLAQSKGLLGKDHDVDFQAVESHRLRRGLALQMDSHVSKRCLIIGDAGGFVPALGCEDLYPTLWSAALAVDRCAEALKAPQPQDALADFDRRWRSEMAGYLRMPSVELRFLVPLIFSNERMAQRLARSFLGGNTG